MTAASNWLPPTWRLGTDDGDVEGYQDGPWTVDEVDKAVKQYQAQGYLTSSRRLTERGRALDPESTLARSIADAVHNVECLRDSWNTPSKVWVLLAKFLPTSVGGFRVDPYHNPGAQGLPNLARTLDGSTAERDGYAVDESKQDVVLERLEKRGLRPTRFDGFPLNWRGDLPVGKAAAAANGRHSDTERFVALCDAYGQEEFVAAFVPYAGDKWLWDVGYRASIVVHLGRAKCAPPPGIEESSPRGPSLGLLWVPPSWQAEKKRTKLPEITQRVLAGESVRVPYHHTRNGVRHVLVTPGSVRDEIDVGMLDVDGRA